MHIIQAWRDWRIKRRLRRKGGFLSDREIRYFAHHHAMIQPYEPSLIKHSKGIKRISYGQSSFGYDARLAEGVKIRRIGHDEYGRFVPVHNPKADSAINWTDLPLHTDETGDFYIIPPLTFFLCTTIECFNLPREVTLLALHKSTYARSGLLLWTSVGEAGWSGRYVLELYNALHEPVRVYVGEGIVQLLFSYDPAGCAVSYADRDGKYNHQQELQYGKV